MHPSACWSISDAVGYELESAIAKNVYPDLCGTRELQQLVLDGLATGKAGQAAGAGPVRLVSEGRGRLPPP